MNKSAFVVDIQNMIVESCTPEEIANNAYLSEAMK
jgi:DNA-binding CsgD family transcriptional regulator